VSVYVSPGVYVREVDLSLYVPALSTTIVGMVGRSTKGPTNEKTYITNQQQFAEVFGPPDSTVGFEAYAALQYLRRGRQLWFVRVVGPAAEEASGNLVAVVDEVADESLGDGDGSTLIFDFTLATVPVKPGTLGVTTTPTTIAEPVLISDDGAGGFDSGVAVTGGAVVAAVDTALSTINYSTGAIHLVFNTGEAPETGTDNITGTYTPLTTTDTYTLTAVTEGEWGNSISYTLSVTDAVNKTYKLMIYYEGSAVERYENLVDDPTDGVNDLETRVNGVSDYVTAEQLGTLTSFVPNENTTPIYLAGGDSDAGNIEAADIIGLEWDATLQQPTGLHLLASPSATDLNLLCAPGWSEASVVTELIAICEARGDCMAIIDPPSDLRPSEVVDWHNGQGTWEGVHAAFNSSYAALYWPWVKVYDAHNRQYVWTPPSGHILAVYAYTDQSTESWFAPAGMNRGHVISGVDIAYDPTRGEMDLLYGDGNAVNPIERFTQDGIVVWGQRTLQRKPSALDRVNVRRLMLYLQKAISTAVRYLVFEPNDDKTWKLFGHAVTPFLNDVRQRRGLYDFRVKCDETTNTPDVIDRNEMRAQIFLKPVKSAEFIQVDLVITTTGTNFDEVLY